MFECGLGPADTKGQQYATLGARSNGLTSGKQGREQRGVGDAGKHDQARENDEPAHRCEGEKPEISYGAEKRHAFSLNVDQALNVMLGGVRGAPHPLQYAAEYSEREEDDHGGQRLLQGEPELGRDNADVWTGLRQGQG